MAFFELYWPLTDSHTSSNLIYESAAPSRLLEMLCGPIRDGPFLVCLLLWCAAGPVGTRYMALGSNINDGFGFHMDFPTPNEQGCADTLGTGRGTDCV